MKTAIYIEDGVVQLVITPENKFEMNALSGFAEKPLSARIFQGSFYDCRGGWVRQMDFNGTPSRDDKSLMLRIDDTTPAAEDN